MGRHADGQRLDRPGDLKAQGSLIISTLGADFVLTYDDGTVVIEVTSTPDPSLRKFNRLLRAGEILKTSRLAI